MIITGNQQLLKSVNRMAIVRKIRMQPGISRADLADAVALTKSTVGKLVEELIDEGWLTETRVLITGHLGRRPTPLRLDNSRRLLLGASINGVNSEVLAMSLGGDVRELSVAEATGSAEEVLDVLAGQIDALYRKLIASGHEVSGIGVAVPGPVRPDIGVLRHSESTGWKEVPVRELLKLRLHALGLPELVLVVERAVGCIALQHFEFERIEDDESMLYAHIGKGIACAAVAGHQVVRGYAGLAGYCAHLPIEANGPLCECGIRGCAKTVLTLHAMELALGVSGDAIQALAVNGDSEVLKVMRETGAKLGTFLFNMCLQYDPARLFAGGPVFQTGGEFARAAQAQLDALAAAAGIKPKRLQVMRFDPHNVALGAATTVLHKLLSATVTTGRAESATERLESEINGAL